MAIVLVGASYRTAAVEERERLAVAEADMGDVLRRLVDSPGIAEAAVVSTCNRVEVIAQAESAEALCAAVQARFGVSDEWVRRHAYVLQSDDALRHLFRVTSSLDSLVLGESQVLGQVKGAFAASTAAGTAGPILSRVFSQALHVAKRVRSETAIAENAVSVSYAAVELAKKVFGRVEGKRVLVVGAGKMAGLAIRHLLQAGVSRLDICNRSVENAQRIAAELGGHAHGLDALPRLLVETDIVISSTGSQLYVIKYELLRDVVARRKYRPLFLIDIAVPRDIEPRCDQLSNVYLFDVDDLSRVVQANMHAREAESARAQGIVDAEVAAARRWFAEHAVVPTIVGLREKLVRFKEAEVEKLLRAHPELSADARAAVERMANQLVNKILHEPTVALRQASWTGSHPELVSAVQSLFSLPVAVAGDPAGATAPERVS